MNYKNPEPEFTRLIKNTFLKSAEEIDIETLAEIQHLRQSAIEKLSRTIYNRLFYPVGTLVTVCLAVVIFTFVTTTHTQTVIPDDFDLLSNSENLEIYVDLEFYEWLAVYDFST
jgi:hypothetical protein